MQIRMHSPFPSDIDLPEKIDFISLEVDGFGCRVVVVEFAKSDPQAYEIVFSPKPLAQRSMDEGAYLSMSWAADSSTRNLDPIVIVTGSDFQDWFHDQSCGIYSRDKVIHVAILTQNEWIEVLCLSLPTINAIAST